MLSDVMQLVIHELHQLLSRILLTTSYFGQHFGDVEIAFDRGLPAVKAWFSQW